MRAARTLLVLLIPSAGISACSTSTVLGDAGATSDAAGATDASTPVVIVDAARAPDTGPRECVGDVRLTTRVYNGTLQPTVVQLTDGQTLAIGLFSTPGTCSGTVIAPNWVLTAKHCTNGSDPARASFRFGPDPASPSFRVAITRFVEHPTADIALLELAQPATALAPDLVPIRITAEALDSTWIGRTVEASGYGRNNVNNMTGTRYFTAEPIAAVGSATVTIDGMGQRGVCFGDSGGPLMTRAVDGTVRVIGALSNGDSSCLGRDNYARVDRVREWIEQQTGPTVQGGDPCGALTAMGRCSGGNALYCGADGVVAVEACAAGSACGWSTAAMGFRCVAAGTDPCAGYDANGACDGQIARWCDNGVARMRDCGSCGQRCSPTTNVGAYCLLDGCMGVDYRGRCDANVAVWCSNGMLRRRDCGAAGCAYINDRIGYFCR